MSENVLSLLKEYRLWHFWDCRRGWRPQFWSVERKECGLTLMKQVKSHLPTRVSNDVKHPNHTDSNILSNTSSLQSTMSCDVAVCFLSSIKILIITSIVGKNIRKLVKDRLIMRRQVTAHSRSRAKAWALSKRKGKHLTSHYLPATLLQRYQSLILILPYF